MTELERCRNWICSALAYSGGTHTYEDVAEAILDHRMQFWPAPKGCLVTEIVDFPRKRVLNVFIAAGEMRQILDMADDVTAWAKAVGCTGLTIHGRRGWERVFARQGWRPLHTCLTKEIEP